MKKLAVIIVVVAILLAGAGGGAWWFFFREPPADDGAGAVAGDPPAYVTLPVMTIPVIRGDRVTRTIALQITLELGDAADEDRVDAMAPRLVDAFLAELHELLARRLMEERGYDLDLLKYRLRDVAGRVVGPDRVTGVLIRAIEQR